MDAPSLADVEQTVDDFSSTHRVWVLPILTGISALGGSASPKNVEAKIRELYAGQVSDLQLAYALKGKHIRWARNEMRGAQLVAGERGTWTITERGREYLDAHRNDKVDFTTVAELDAAEAGNLAAPLETVQTTAKEAFEIPLLRCLVEGLSETQTLLGEIETRLRDKLLPGDMRLMPDGSIVSAYRITWALSSLKMKGHARSIRRGVWEVTDAGRQRLTQDGDSWDVVKYQESKSKVRAESATTGVAHTIAPPHPEPTVDLLGPWRRLKQRVGASLFQALDARIRPDLEATPTIRIPRSVILYGPPGTGKTFVAKLVAQALTGEEESGPESSWRIVQFHPSYAYEDFVQGLRPDLEQATVRYQLAKGPFFQICAQAEEDPDNFYVLIIDEINRGDPARIFGELLYAMEYRGEPVDLALGGQLRVPPNLVIIGTMNSVDRSVALVDYALRRRFGFVRLQPSPQVIVELRSNEPAAEMAAEVLGEFNSWLTSQLGKEHALGHSMFLNAAHPLENAGSLHAIWEGDVLPLLEEFFFGDATRLTEASLKWRAVVAEASRDEDTAPV
jgi:5-methylcytosine-specific restriction protein B